jgi:hypothetical protein
MAACTCFLLGVFDSRRLVLDELSHSTWLTVARRKLNEPGFKLIENRRRLSGHAVV